MDVDSTMSSESDHDQDKGVAPEQLNGQSSAGGSLPETPKDEQQPATSQQQQGSTLVAGPRCAPTYSVVHAVMEKKEDGPGPRCGHTLTAVPAVGEEGSPNYIGPRLILFGGATALEGNSAGSGTPSSAGSAGIRMFPPILLIIQLDRPPLFWAIHGQFLNLIRRWFTFQLCRLKAMNEVSN